MGAVRNINMPWLALVRQADQGFDHAKRHESAYDFEAAGNGRRFYVNSLSNGAYHDQRTFLIDEYGRIVTDENGNAVMMDGSPK